MPTSIVVSAPPGRSHSHVPWYVSPPTTLPRITRDAASDAPMHRTVHQSPWRGSRRPTAAWTRKPTSGARTTTRASVSTGSALELGDLVDVDVVARVEHVEDDRQRDRRLGGGDGEDEDREDGPAQRRGAEPVERDEVHVRRVEDQLEPDQDADGVAPREDGRDARAEEHGARGEVVREADHGPLRLR